MNTMHNEEVQYCNHCGAANKKSSVVCADCGKNIHISYKPFYDFLKKHTKDELSGVVTDSVFSYIKNFLVSHMYGVALSVTIVAASASAVYALEPHIKEVSHVRSSATEMVSDNDEEENIPLSEDDITDFDHLTSNYDAFADSMRSSDAYWDLSQAHYSSAGEMYAENNIAGFTHAGIHEMLSNPIPMHAVDLDPAFEDLEYTNLYSDRYLDISSAVQGKACTSYLAKALLDEGYRVAECNYVLSEGVGEYDFNTHSGGDVIKQLVYKFVFVEKDGKWYIAEDRLVSRKNV